MMRLSRLRSTARLALRLLTATPNRAEPSRFGRAMMVKNESDARVPCLKTLSKSAAERRRDSRPNVLGLLRPV